jgi:hypothetical protein
MQLPSFGRFGRRPGLRRVHPRPPVHQDGHRVFDGRYRPLLVEAAYWLLLTGTGGRFAAEAARAWSTNDVLGWIVVVGATSQVAGMAVYFWTMWTRIRPAGSHLRESKGEKF